MAYLAAGVNVPVTSLTSFNLENLLSFSADFLRRKERELDFLELLRKTLFNAGFDVGVPQLSPTYVELYNMLFTSTENTWSISRYS